MRPGEIHGLVGENGSGKSTLMRVLAGDLVPDEGGRVTIDENPLPFGSPIVAQRLGVGLIPQELMIVEALSALENVFMGDYPKRGPWVAWRRMSQEFARLCESLDVSLDPHAVASDLSVADLTMVEIMRATRREAKVLLMDEPTAALGRSEREKLYALVRRLAGHGRTVIFISHDLDEVLALTDVITVLRDGRHVATQPASAWTKRALVERMVGDASVALGFEKALAEARPEAAPTAVPAAQAPDQDVVLSARNVTVPGKLAARVLRCSARRDPRYRRARGLGALDALAGARWAAAPERRRAPHRREAGSSGLGRAVRPCSLGSRSSPRSDGAKGSCSACPPTTT